AEADNHTPGCHFPLPGPEQAASCGWPSVLTWMHGGGRLVREFGELEMAIMDVMWAANSPCTTREVRERMRYGRPVAYTTVMTVCMALAPGNGRPARDGGVRGGVVGGGGRGGGRGGGGRGGASPGGGKRGGRARPRGGGEGDAGAAGPGAAGGGPPGGGARGV